MSTCPTCNLPKIECQGMRDGPHLTCQSQNALCPTCGERMRACEGKRATQDLACHLNNPVTTTEEET